MKSLIANNPERANALVLIVFSTLILSPQLAAAELEAETLRAWVEYVRISEGRIDRELESETNFFNHDSQPAKPPTPPSGEVRVAKMRTKDLRGRSISVPDGAIHHWRGSVFIPDTDLKTVLASVSNPDQGEPLQEDVLEARVLERGQNSLRVYLKLIRKKIVTVAYNTEHLVRLRRHGGKRASGRSVATRIAELRNVNTPQEEERPAGQDRGFLWRLNSYWKYEEQGGGVFVECESLTLSRDYPSILKPLLGPIVSSVARESMQRTLASMRDRLAGRYFQPQGLDTAKGS